jgi:hypothetical protein
VICVSFNVHMSRPRPLSTTVLLSALQVIPARVIDLTIKPKDGRRNGKHNDYSHSRVVPGEGTASLTQTGHHSKDERQDRQHTSHDASGDKLVALVAFRHTTTFEAHILGLCDVRELHDGRRCVKKVAYVKARTWYRSLRRRHLQPHSRLCLNRDISR